MCQKLGPLVPLRNFIQQRMGEMISAGLAVPGGWAVGLLGDSRLGAVLFPTADFSTGMSHHPLMLSLFQPQLTSSSPNLPSLTIWGDGSLGLEHRRRIHPVLGTVPRTWDPLTQDEDWISRVSCISTFLPPALPHQHQRPRPVLPRSRTQGPPCLEGPVLALKLF